MNVKQCIDELKSKNYSYLPGSIIVSFDEKFPEKEIRDVMSEYDLNVKKYWDLCNCVHVEVPEGLEFEWICKLKQDERIKHAEPNLESKAYANGEKTNENCIIKIPKTIKLVALTAFSSSEIDSDHIGIHIPKNLCVPSYSPEADGYYIVQFKGSVYDKDKNDIISLGGTMHGYIPEHAFIVKMSETAKNNVQNLDSVKWVGIYQPAYKMQPDLIDSLDRTGNILLTVLVFSGEDKTDIADKINALGGTTTTTANIRTLIDASKIPEIANIIGVHFIEEYKMPTIDLA
ncbi:MAG: hypothetical protein J7K00_04065 [Candidatus Diapherotrites archaeon]|nr:hypothetical protein [Candidatus Diapherotrites archaeon]